MGVAIVSSTSLDLNLPSLVWKALVNSPINEADLEVRVPRAAGARGGARSAALRDDDGGCWSAGERVWRQAIDTHFVQTTLATMRGTAAAGAAAGHAVPVRSNDRPCGICWAAVRAAAEPHTMGLTEETFGHAIFNTFTVMSAAGREVPLLPGGEDLPVTWENRLEYARLGTSSRSALRETARRCLTGRVRRALRRAGARQPPRTTCTSLTSRSQRCGKGSARCCRSTC